MAFDRFLVGFLDNNAGLQTNLRPWLIADNAFEVLNNAYVFRGRVRKRFGATYMIIGGKPEQSRFRVQVGTIAAPVSPVPGTKFSVGQMFSAGSQLFTVFQAGNPAAMLATGPGTGTFSTVTGAFALVGTGLAGATPIYWYPALPVMGLTNYEIGPINDQPSYGFDTEFAYVFIAGSGWERSVSAGNPVFNAVNRADAGTLNFFWTTNWQDVINNLTILFITNFNATVPVVSATDDPMWTFNGTVWAIFRPIFLTAGNSVSTARIIVAFKDRLLLLNTVENTKSDGTGTNSAHTNRCRYSFNGSPFATNAWLEPNNTTGGTNAAGAGFIDASTKEAIVSAEFIKDRLIVFFERSTWELAYTGNQILPFVWQKINTELGSESQQSSVPFDKEILTIGNTGVHACSGANVERIDNKIPDSVFEIVDKDTGVQRVAGIRDYFVEMVYWTFPALGANPEEGQVFPNRVLVYNYKNSAWAFNDDCITAFGYFEQQQDITWAQATFTWQETFNTWISGIEQSQSRQIVAGNQEGFTFLIDPDLGRNAAVMQITNITVVAGDTILTIINHTLNDNIPDFIAIEESIVGALPTLTGRIFKIQSLPVADPLNTVNIGPTSFIAGTYNGGGFVTRVSNINIKTKQWNPYANKDQNIYLQRIDFGVFKTSHGEITVDYEPSSTNLSMINEGIVSGSIMGNNILETRPYDPLIYPLETIQQRLWHPIYFQTSGNCIQLVINFSDAQIIDPNIAWSDFVIEAMILYTQSVSARMQ